MIDTVRLRILKGAQIQVREHPSDPDRTLSEV